MKRSIILSALTGMIMTTAQAQCVANFTVAQATSPARGAIAWHIQVTDNSTGANLSYHWDFGDGTSANAQAPIHQYSGTGPYLLCLTVISPATATTPACTSAVFCDTINVDSTGHLKSADLLTLQIGDGSDGLVSTTTGIENSSTPEVAFEVFPNPVQTAARINLTSEENGTATMELYNMKGQMVWNTREAAKTGNNNYLVDLSAFDSGLYLLKVTTGREAASALIVKE